MDICIFPGCEWPAKYLIIRTDNLKEMFYCYEHIDEALKVLRLSGTDFKVYRDWPLIRGFSKKGYDENRREFMKNWEHIKAVKQMRAHIEQVIG